VRHTLLTTPQAIDCLLSGQIIAYPTEAVFGLGCDPNNESALRNLLALKNRSASAGLVLIGSSLAQFTGWIDTAPAAQRQIAEQTWPGPYTWLFPRGEKASELLAGDHKTLAIRVTAHQPCIDLCNAFGGPLVSTSANPHSAKPARSAGEVEDYFGSFLGGILEGPLGGLKNASEIRDLNTGLAIREG
jgi:L-threonylcarbamoyladenylate synthase